MSFRQPSSTVAHSASRHQQQQQHAKLNLSHLPPLYIFSGNIPTEELHALQDELIQRGALITLEAQETNVFVAKVGTKKRAQFELRRAGIWSEEVLSTAEVPSKKRKHEDEPKTSGKSRKLSRKLSSSDTESDQEDFNSLSILSERTDEEVSNIKESSFPTGDHIIVVKLQWLQDSLAQSRLLSHTNYLIYSGTRTSKPDSKPRSSPPPNETHGAQHDEPTQASAILSRARADTPPAHSSRATRFASAPYGTRRFRDQGQRWDESSKRPSLLALETTSQDGADADLPPAPAWVRQRLMYACQRATPAVPANAEFVELLKKIRLARLLTGDEIGVRAYSSAIAAAAAVPTRLLSAGEVLRLPGCDVKIANLWVEYRKTGTIEAAAEVDADETLCVLNQFYEIWGVGEKTAREFYYDRGWRDLDDVLEYGWDTLSRVQQIGLKYYDEFHVGIPRAEVELILAKVREHAAKVRGDGIEAMVVGGYRRGKEESGDVDIVVSHRELAKTADLVTDVVASLEDEGWITHTLTLALTATHRGQSTLPFRGGAKVPNTGFDTLDKALVVWQDPDWPTKELDLKRNPKTKNANLHRRVDIIISPWRTVGCAVLGWSGGNTFQRDVRRYAKYIKEWKFDSSGIRSRRTGEVIQVEGPDGVDGSMIDAEMAVFKGLGLEYREPSERCTG